MVDLPDEVKNMPMRAPEPEKPAEPRRPSGEGERSSGYRRDSGRGGGGRQQREGGGRGGASGGGQHRGFPRRRRKVFGAGKVCSCCVQKVKYVDYKDVDFLLRFVSSQGKILPRRLSGACSRHQRLLTTAIKRARNIALLPFTA